MNTRKQAELFIGVPAGSIPTGTDANRYGVAHQPSGSPVRGIVMDADDPRIPESVYYVSITAAEIETVGVIRASNNDAMGGDKGDQMVPLIIDFENAVRLAHDMKMLALLAHTVGPEPHIDFSQRDEQGKRIGADARSIWGRQVVTLLHARAQKDGWSWRGVDADLQLEEYSLSDWTTNFFWARDIAGAGTNPIFFGATAEKWSRIPAEGIGVIAIPKACLKTGALITNFSIDVSHGLQEMRVYGDVPLHEDWRERKDEA